MKKYILLSLVIGIFITTSCDKHCVDGRGQIIDREVHVKRFTSVSFSTWGTVKIFKSNEYKVVITANQNIVTEYDPVVIGEELRVKSSGCFSSPIQPVINVYCPEIKGVKHSGSGDIAAVDTFYTDNLDVKLSGSGNIDLFSVEAKNCDVKISGSGDVKVRVIDYIDANISGSGNIYYKNYPAIHEKISGSGDVLNGN